MSPPVRSTPCDATPLSRLACPKIFDFLYSKETTAKERFHPATVIMKSPGTSTVGFFDRPVPGVFYFAKLLLVC
jgi:hypothetical protein